MVTFSNDGAFSDSMLLHERDRDVSGGSVSVILKWRRSLLVSSGSDVVIYNGDENGVMASVGGMILLQLRNSRGNGVFMTVVAV